MITTAHWWFFWIGIIGLVVSVGWYYIKKEARPYYIIYRKESGITDEDITLYLTYSEFDDCSEEGFTWSPNASDAYCFDSFEKAQWVHIRLLGSTILKV